MMNIIDKLYSFLSVSIIISCCCTLIVGWVPIFARTWIWALTVVLLSIFIYRRGILESYILPLLLYGLVLYINAYAGDERFNFISSTMELCSLFTASYMFYIYNQYSFNKISSLFLLLFFIVLILTFCGTSYVYEQNPDILRIIQSSVNEGNTSLFKVYARLGVESYGMGHAIPCLIPIVIYVVKKSTDIAIKVLYILLLFMIISLVYMSTATTALMLSFGLVIIAFMLNANRFRNISVIILFFGVVFFITNNRVLLDQILSNITIESNVAYTGKLDDFQDYVKYGSLGEQTDGRINLYKQSLEQFCISPLFGSDNNSNIGGHSIILDRLAMLGLLGVIPLIMYLYRYMRYVLSLLSKDIQVYCLCGFIFFVIMALLKNIFTFEYIVITLFILPLLSLYVDRILLPPNYNNDNL